MADEPSKSKSKAKDDDDAQAQRAREVAESPEDAQSDAEAPGPITPEHESGSWEQTLAEQEASGKAPEDRKS